MHQLEVAQKAFQDLKVGVDKNTPLDRVRDHIEALRKALILTVNTPEEESVAVTGRRAFDATRRVAESVVERATSGDSETSAGSIDRHEAEQCARVIDHVVRREKNANDPTNGTRVSTTENPQWSSSPDSWGITREKGGPRMV